MNAVMTAETEKLPGLAWKVRSHPSKLDILAWV